MENRKIERRGEGYPYPFYDRREIEFRDRRNRERLLAEGDGRRVKQRRSWEDRRQ